MIGAECEDRMGGGRTGYHLSKVNFCTKVRAPLKTKPREASPPPPA